MRTLNKECSGSVTVNVVGRSPPTAICDEVRLVSGTVFAKGARSKSTPYMEMYG